MSRRPPAGADRSEQNRATLKQLVKLESNKSCGDCKRNKHPRWASWNIGVFICIRCSGIHRGMGTHVSKVKSVDLDTWTDEQMASMLKWGNQRVNKYWEYKLAEGHVPNEAKIENFIRTKYDSRRWVMDGPVPVDPSVLDDEGQTGEDDELPLNVVQEKVKQREASGGVRSGGGIAGPPRARQQEVDLFGDMNEPAAAQPVRPSTTEPAISRPGQPRALPQQAAAAKQSKPGESLLGLDFFGGASATPARPSSTGPGTPGTGRSDLKQSILSLYASKPAAPAPQPAANAFGGMQSPASPAGLQSNTSALSGMDDAFGSLSFSSPAPQQPKSTPFSNFSAPSGHSKQPSVQKSALSGGSFFDAKPAPPPKSNPSTQTTNSFSNDFGNDFGDFSSASPVMSTKSPAAATSSMGDLFDMSAPAPPPKPAPITSAGFSAAKSPTTTSTYSSSAFNLSQPAAAPKPTPAPAASHFSAMNSMDAWGSSDAWATPDPPAATKTSPPISSPPTSTFKSTPAPPAMTSAFDSGWGDPEPVAPAKPATTTTSGASGFSVQQDEEFGGWSHASPVATNPPPKSGGGGMGGGGGSDDLFGNVWG